jgi:hypothetical protein
MRVGVRARQWETVATSRSLLLTWQRRVRFEGSDELRAEPDGIIFLFQSQVWPILPTR